MVTHLNAAIALELPANHRDRPVRPHLIIPPMAIPIRSATARMWVFCFVNDRRRAMWPSWVNPFHGLPGRGIAE